ELLEVDVADIPGVVVARDHDERLALDPVEVALRGRVLLLEPERRQVAGADDNVGLQVVDLGNRSLHQVRHEMRRTAVEVREVRDCQRRQDQDFRASEAIATLHSVVPETPVFQAYRGSEAPRFASPAELEYAP